MSRAGTLYVVATPIGNLEDMTLRGIRVLKEADLIAAEDTRHTRKLLTHFGIHTPVTSYFEHNKRFKGDAIIAALRQGKDVALVSDAGTPGISDPGFELVRDAVDTGINVVPVPGPCAAVAAASISGLPSESLAFEGFLPSREKARREKLSSLRQDGRTIIFYESPQRVISTLNDIRDNIGDRRVAVIREITKLHEEVLRGTVSEVTAIVEKKGAKGEFVIVLEGRGTERFVGSIKDELSRAVEGGLSMKEAVEAVAKGLGIKKSEVYREGLKIRTAGGKR